MTECFARRFLRGERSRQSLGAVAIALRVRQLFGRENFFRESSEPRVVEIETLDFGDVGSQSDDHALLLPLARDPRGGLERTGLKIRDVEKISLVPINGVGTDFCERLAPCLEERFLHKFAVEKPLTLSPALANSTRRQYFLNTVFNRMLAAFPNREGMLLGVMGSDLYKTSHNYIFGDASETDRVAVVSTFRLRPEFYREPANASAMFERTVKECVHALGHAFGLKHCFNARCAMYYSNTVYDTDGKLNYFCDSCDKRVRARR